MVIVKLSWWVSISVMVDRSGGLVWCGRGDGLLVVVDCGCCGVVRRERKKERERERERERGNKEPATNPTRCHFYL